MSRFNLAALLGVALSAAPVAAQQGKNWPPQGELTEVTYTDKHPPFGGARIMHFYFDIKQGDRFRVEAQGAGGVEMAFHVKACEVFPSGEFYHIEEGLSKGPSLDWTGTKGLSGKAARLDLLCTKLGQVNVRITRIDANGKEYPAAPRVQPKNGPPTPDLEARVKRLEDQNTQILNQLETIRRLLDQKK